MGTMKLELKARTTRAGWPEGIIEWDPETGEIKSDNPYILEIIHHGAEFAKKHGYIETRPFDTAIPYKDPFHNIVEFTALIGFIWHPPPELEKYYPVYKAIPYGLDVIV